MSDIVPFGKYKGKPLEVLAQDTDYLEWLKTQPWFREKFDWIEKAIIVVQNGPQTQTPDETPAHNRMQALFLSDRFQFAFACCLHRRTISRWHTDYKKWVKEQICDTLENIRRHVDEINAAPEKYKEKRAEWEAATYNQGREWPDWKEEAHNRTIEERQKWLARDRTTLRQLEMWDVPFIEADVRFEHRGIDVTLTISVENGYGDLFREDLVSQIECKPQVGDDYPAVLRQMNANKSNILFIGEFNSEVLTLEGLRKFMKPSGKKVVMLSDVAAAWSDIPEWILLDDDEEMPLLLRALLD